MKLYIADVIAKRRRELNLTQEELASRIGVSAQAVSNWERKTGYPDVLLIPALANALGISTDALFGVGNQSDAEILEQFKGELRQMATQEEQKECLMRYYHQYPNTYCILEWIIWMVYREYRDDLKLITLAKQLGRRILAECTDAGFRITAGKVLAFICDDDEAQEYINTFDEHVLVRPNIIGRRLWDKQDYTSAHDYFDLEMVLLFQYIVGRSSYCADVPEQAIKWNELLIDLLKTIGNGNVPEGWLGNYGLTLIRLAAAQFACGNKDLGYKNLEEALKIYEKWYSFSKAEKLSVGRLSLFDNIRFSRAESNSTVYIGDNPYEYYGIWETNVSVPLTAESGWNWFDTVRDEERFAEIMNAAIELERKYTIAQS
ncbi:MAG: helix-turn-helix domain-containing protein [Clostridia bacterium]|nr:helix-turn-helix domain-containing protein [Clostridia bacterium]